MSIFPSRLGRALFLALATREMTVKEKKALALTSQNLYVMLLGNLLLYLNL